jgi:anhydro-N-acetylmuramic acid kinase
MNKKLSELLTKAQQGQRLYVGLMSGTSLDGLDVALCRIDELEGKINAEVSAFRTYAFTDELKQMLHNLAFRDQVSLKDLSMFNALFGDFCGNIVLQLLKIEKLSPDEVTAIASHGQTLFHAPNSYSLDGNTRSATLQAGDADHIAVKTGLAVISDFRQKHTALGGEGAPLAGYLDFALFHSEDENRILLNLGGIANLSYIPKNAASMEACMVSDIGPANTLINQAMKVFYGKDFDQDGQTASKGKVHPALLSELHRHPFLHHEAPKSTGPENFSLSWLQATIKSLNADDLFSEDIIATLTRFSAECIGNALKALPESEVIVSGGGLHNPVLMGMIRELSAKHTFLDMNRIGIPPDAKEALLMACLADSLLQGKEPMLGKISLP